MTDTAKTIILKGDPKKPESAEHIIIFPGGSISVCRTSDNEYWAHIEVSRVKNGHGGTRTEKNGRIVDSRVDFDFYSLPQERQTAENMKVIPIEDHKYIKHIAVRIFAD